MEKKWRGKEILHRQRAREKNRSTHQKMTARAHCQECVGCQFPGAFSSIREMVELSFAVLQGAGRVQVITPLIL